MATLGTKRIPSTTGRLVVAAIANAAPTTPPVARAIKRSFDVCASLAGLIAFSWLFALVAIAIKWDSRGTVLFTQRRLGKDGKLFTILKFRTMEAAAPETDEARHKNRTTGLLYKNVADPRITQFGRWLRRTSLDELPQLWNVLKGEMSLVGPRPLPSEDSRYYDGKAWARLAVVPGMSGLWQVSGRSNLPAEDMIRLDLEYIREWSLAMDAKILFQTVNAVVSGEGAY